MKINLKKSYDSDTPVYVVDFLANSIELSKVKIKKTIDLGGLWIKSSQKSRKSRIKKIKTLISKGDQVEFNFDSSLTIQDDFNAFEIYKGHDFSVWFKPANMLTEGTPYSDKGSLSHLVKSNSKKCFLVQRLDKEVSGVLIVAYSKKMAAFFSKEVQDKNITKLYQAKVIGTFDSKNDTIESDLDGKSCLTKFEVKETSEGVSSVLIELITGRFHQIRRHFNHIGHPLLGDPRYGEGNKNKTGLCLVSYACEFFDPQKRKRVRVEIPNEFKLF